MPDYRQDKTNWKLWAFNCVVGGTILIFTVSRLLRVWPDVEPEDRLLILIGGLAVPVACGIGFYLYERQFRQSSPRTWAQFSLRNLLIATAWVAVLLGLLFWPTR